MSSVTNEFILNKKIFYGIKKLFFILIIYINMNDIHKL
jgi:hypothetical protein